MDRKTAFGNGNDKSETGNVAESISETKILDLSKTDIEKKEAITIDEIKQLVAESEELYREYDEIIYMTPDGETFTQGMANELSLKENIIILCGHYKGVDQRVRDHLITREITVGDYVLSGGEIPAAIVADAIVRLLPGAITDETSALSDCYQDGLLSPPIYTRPAEFNGWKVPEVLLSGNPRLIREWQDEQAIERTKKLRPKLLSE